MLFRKQDGSMVEVKRSDFKNDELYYTYIMDIKNSLVKEKKQPIKEPGYATQSIANLLKTFV